MHSNQDWNVVKLCRWTLCELSLQMIRNDEPEKGNWISFFLVSLCLLCIDTTEIASYFRIFQFLAHLNTFMGPKFVYAGARHHNNERWRYISIQRIWQNPFSHQPPAVKTRITFWLVFSMVVLPLFGHRCRASLRLSRSRPHKTKMLLPLARISTCSASREKKWCPDTLTITA